MGESSNSFRDDCFDFHIRCGFLYINENASAASENQSTKYLRIGKSRRGCLLRWCVVRLHRKRSQLQRNNVVTCRNDSEQFTTNIIGKNCGTNFKRCIMKTPTLIRQSMLTAERNTSKGSEIKWPMNDASVRVVVTNTN